MVYRPQYRRSATRSIWSRAEVKERFNQLLERQIGFCELAGMGFSALHRPAYCTMFGPDHPFLMIGANLVRFNRRLAIRGNEYGAVSTRSIEQRHVMRLRDGYPLTDAGLRAREEAQRALFTAHGKASHRAALESVQRLQALCPRAVPDLGIGAFAADAGEVGEVQDGLQWDPVDIVITDVPHGDLSRWRGSVLDGDANPIVTLLDATLVA